MGNAKKKINKISKKAIKILNIIIFGSLAYSAAVLYYFGATLLAGGIALSLVLYVIFNQLDSLSK